MEPQQDVQEQEAPEPEAQQGWLLSRLFDDNVSMRRYVLRAGLISFLPSMAISITLAALGVMTEKTGPSFEGDPLFILFLVLLVSPPLETFLMVPILRLLSLITKREIRLAAMSACVWAVLHSLMAPAWGLTVIWPFFVFSCSYLHWRRRSFWAAILVTSLIHLIQNLVPGIVFLCTQ